MRYLSVCSGIEAATAAWHPLDWQPVGFSEIEKFPAAVLAHHYPDVPNFGDMTKFKEWPDDLAPNLIVGGTPCQSFSVAGLRKGLSDPRGNLALTYLALADRYRPEWLVWENVPGVLSSNGGRDFGAFLGGLVELGYGFAYRVLDAQYFGVAQRRRRVFVVANSRDWRRAAAVLFERHSLSGHPAPCREAGEGASRGAGQGVDGGGERVISMAHGQGGAEIGFNRGPTLTCNHEAPIVAHSLRGEGFDASEDGTGRGTPLVPVAFGGQMSVPQVDFDLSQTLQAKNPQAVTVSLRGRDGGTTAEIGDEVGNALRASQGGGDKAHVLSGMAVRRLTPIECERLQGFSDGYTAIPWRKKPASECPDGPRYKALGNSMAVPVMRWIGERIAAVDAQRELEEAE